MSKSSVRRPTWLVPALTLILAGAAAAQQPASDDPLYRAYQAEVAQRDFAAAETLYAQAIADLEKSGEKPGAAKLVDAIAKARTGRARCLVALGRKEEAKQELLVVLESRPDDKDAKLELAKLTAPDAAAARIAARVDELLAHMSETPGAMLPDFPRMGDVAVPTLAQRLRDEDVTLVARAAKALTWIETPASYQAIAAAIADPKLLYPGVVVEALIERLSNGLRATPTTLPVFLAVLSRKEEELRRCLVEGLADRYVSGGEPAATIEVLQRLLRDDSEQIRDRAASIQISRSSAEAFLPVLQQMLDTPDRMERRRAATLIARNIESLPRPALDELIDRIKKDRDPQIRMNALLAECQRHERDPGLAVYSVLALLSDEDPQPFAAGAAWIEPMAPVIPESAHEILARAVARCIDDPALRDDTRSLVTKHVDRFHLTDDELVDLFVQAGSPKGGWAEGKLDDVRAQLARLVASSVGKADFDERATVILRRIPDVKGRRIWFQRWARKETPNLVKAAANDEDLSVRRMAYGIGLTPRSIDSTELPHLAEDLPQLDEKSQQRVLETFRPMPNPALVAPLRAIHEKARGELEIGSLRVLGFAGGKEATPDLLASLRSRKPGEPYICLDLLAKEIGESQVVSELVAAAQRHGSARTVVLWLNFVDWGQRVPASVIESFVRQAAPELLRLEDLKEIAPYLPLDLLRERVTAALRGADRDEQLVAADLVGEYKLDFAWDDLVRLLDDGDGAVRVKAMGSLQMLREYRELRGVTNVPDAAARRDAFEKASKLAASKESGHRIAAALAFGALGDVAAVAPLLDLAVDPDPSVRAAAVKALEKLDAAPASAPAAAPKSEKKQER